MEEQKNRLYIGNLPYSTTGDQLKVHFEQIGEVTDSVVITDKMSGRSKGFGFVTMASDELAEKAVAELDGKELDGRPLKVNIARAPRERV
jgi:RNA recognition motif-containing protein